MGPGTLGAADDGTQIVGIFDAVQKNDERILSLRFGCLEHIFYLTILHAGRKGADTLMIGCFPPVAKGHANLIQLPPVYFLNDKLPLPGTFQDLPQRTILFFCYQDLIDAAAGFDGLPYGVTAKEHKGKFILLLFPGTIRNFFCRTAFFILLKTPAFVGLAVSIGLFFSVGPLAEVLFSIELFLTVGPLFSVGFFLRILLFPVGTFFAVTAASVLPFLIAAFGIAAVVPVVIAVCHVSSPLRLLP